MARRLVPSAPACMAAVAESFVNQQPSTYGFNPLRHPRIHGHHVNINTRTLHRFMNLCRRSTESETSARVINSVLITHQDLATALPPSSSRVDPTHPPGVSSNHTIHHHLFVGQEPQAFVSRDG